MLRACRMPVRNTEGNAENGGGLGIRLRKSASEHTGESKHMRRPQTLVRSKAPGVVPAGVGSSNEST